MKGVLIKLLVSMFAACFATVSFSQNLPDVMLFREIEISQNRLAVVKGYPWGSDTCISDEKKIVLKCLKDSCNLLLFAISLDDNRNGTHSFIVFDTTSMMPTTFYYSKDGRVVSYDLKYDHDSNLVELNKSVSVDNEQVRLERIFPHKRKKRK